MRAISAFTRVFDALWRAGWGDVVHGLTAVTPAFPTVIPAQAGIQYAAAYREGTAYWIPARARYRSLGRDDGLMRVMVLRSPRQTALAPYLCSMNLIRRTLDIDALTDARLREIAAERGQDEAAVLAEAVALLDSVVDIGSPDIAEDRRRLEEFKRTREAIPLHEVKAWVESWGTDKELPRPKPHRIG